MLCIQGQILISGIKKQNNQLSVLYAVHCCCKQIGPFVQHKIQFFLVALRCNERILLVCVSIESELKTADIAIQLI